MAAWMAACSARRRRAPARLAAALRADRAGRALAYRGRWAATRCPVHRLTLPRPASPYELDAHDARKYTTSRVGCTVHLTETCEDDAPHLITTVATTAAPLADGETTSTVHQALREKGLLPAIHLVETGSLDAEPLVSSQREYGVELLGLTRPDVNRMTHGRPTSASVLTPKASRSTGSTNGRRAPKGTPAELDTGRRQPSHRRHEDQMLHARLPALPQPQSVHPFAQTVPAAHQRDSAPGSLSRAPCAARARADGGVSTAYARRAGIEATISQGVRVLRLRRSRDTGLARTHLRHILTATGLNFLRVASWLAGIPRAGTRPSHFVALMAEPASA